jgi:hypothetical protein
MQNEMFIMYEDERGCIVYRPVSKIARIRERSNSMFEVMFDLGKDVERAILTEKELGQRGTFKDFFG